MTNIEKIECFANELKSLLKWGEIDITDGSLFNAIIKTLKLFADMPTDDLDSMDDREVKEAFKKEYEIFSKLKALGEKEGIL